jgi:hypothetical protein
MSRNLILSTSSLLNHRLIQICGQQNVLVANIQETVRGKTPDIRAKLCGITHVVKGGLIQSCPA